MCFEPKKIGIPAAMQYCSASGLSLMSFRISSFGMYLHGEGNVFFIVRNPFLTLINIPFITINFTPYPERVDLQEISTVMKKNTLLGIFMLVFAVQIAFGQQEGVITYEIRINVHRTLPAGQEGRKAMVPEFRTFKEQLFFNESASYCKPLIEEDDDDANNGGRRRFRMRNETYCDQTSGKITLVQADLIGKTYL